MKKPSLKSLAARAALVAALATGGVIAGQESASATLGDCPSGHVCLWYNSNFNGTTSAEYTATTGVISVNARSRYNKTTKCAAYYDAGGLFATGDPNTGWGSGLHTYTTITLTTC